MNKLDHFGTPWARLQQPLGGAVLACLHCGADRELPDACSAAELAALAVEWQQLHARCDSDARVMFCQGIELGDGATTGCRDGYAIRDGRTPSGAGDCPVCHGTGFEVDWDRDLAQTPVVLGVEP